MNRRISESVNAEFINSLILTSLIVSNSLILTSTIASYAIAFFIAAIKSPYSSNAANWGNCFLIGSGE